MQHSPFFQKSLCNIICFDGKCNLCDGFVNFIIAIDGNDKIKFCSLQSKTGQDILQELSLKNDLATIIYVESLEKRVYYSKSEAILQIAKTLGFPYVMFYWIGYILIPSGTIRNIIYDWVASNRYYVFGQSDTCRKPSKHILSKFL